MRSFDRYSCNMLRYTRINSWLYHSFCLMFWFSNGNHSPFNFVNESLVKLMKF